MRTHFAAVSSNATKRRHMCIWSGYPRLADRLLALALSQSHKTSANQAQDKSGLYLHFRCLHVLASAFAFSTPRASRVDYVRRQPRAKGKSFGVENGQMGAFACVSDTAAKSYSTKKYCGNRREFGD